TSRFGVFVVEGCEREDDHDLEIARKGSIPQAFDVESEMGSGEELGIDLDYEVVAAHALSSVLAAVGVDAGGRAGPIRGTDGLCAVGSRYNDIGNRETAKRVLDVVDWKTRHQVEQCLLAVVRVNWAARDWRVLGTRWPGRYSQAHE